MAESQHGIRSTVYSEASPADTSPILRLVQAVAFLGMLAGLGGLISLPFGLQRLHDGSLSGSLDVGYYSDPMVRPSIDVIWLFLSSALGTGLSAMLLLGSLAALNFHPLARPILLLWSIASLVIGSIGSVFYVRWLLLPWRERYAEVRGVIDSLANIGSWGIAMGLAFIFLLLLTRPSVKLAFQRRRKH